jgi:hypothetical protein
MQRLAACLFLGLVLGGSETGLRAQSFTFTTLAGSAPGTNDGANSAAQFYFPSGIAVDNAGNLFVADTSNNTIRKVTPVGPDWVVTTIAGMAAFGGAGGTSDGTNGAAQFWRPNGVAVDGQGNVYVVDHYSHTVRKLTPVGTNWVVTTLVGLGLSHGYADGTNSDARFWSPTGIALDRAGNLYVADTFTYTIRKIVSVGTNWVVTTIAGSPFNYGFVNAANTNAQFDLPFGLAIDRSTNIYVADYGNNAIRKIAPVGTNWVVTTVAGSGTTGTNNGANTHAQFDSPADLGVDLAGNLFVTDQYNYTIRKITPVGTNWVVSTVAGLALQSGASNGIGAAARFNKPWGLALQTNGFLFVVDYANQRIREGVPSSSAAPSLSISLSGTNVVLAWPLSAAGFVLESRSNLFPGASWLSLSNGVVISGNSFALTTNSSAGAAFYRLHAP